MYIPKAFKIRDEQFNHEIINDYGFATLFSQHNGEPYATHIPLMLSEDKTYLYGHFSVANHQWKDIEGQTVLAVFQGPHSYISSSWYETNRSVPTWNYISVHVSGVIEMIGGRELKESLSRLVHKYEAPDSAYQLDEVDDRYLKAMRTAIKGFRIKISKIEGKAKLSQNHSEERRSGVIEKLEASKKEDERKIAAYMKELM